MPDVPDILIRVVVLGAVAALIVHEIVRERRAGRTPPRPLTVVPARVPADARCHQRNVP